MNEEELDTLVICKKCHTLHKKIKLHHNAKALCQHCNSVIYRNQRNLFQTTLALSFTALILLIVAFSFEIITININGINQSLTLSSLFVVIFQEGYYLVGIMLFFLILLFPILILGSLILLLVLMHQQRLGYLVKRLLILIAKLRPWSMVDIFFVSILVAMVKLFDYAQIELGVSFVALLCLLMLDAIIIKRISFAELWSEYERIYKEHS